MFNTFIQGLLLGFGAAVPIGPINILLMNYALHSFKEAFVLGVGAMSADLLYLTLIMTGLIHAADELPFLSMLNLLGGLFLLYLAWGSFRSRHQHLQRQKIKKQALLKIYLKGFSLTLLNPYTIGFWLSASLLAQQSTQNPLLLIAGMIIAILTWVSVMPYAVHRSRHLISDTMLSRLSIVSALILAGFAVMLLVNIKL